MAKDLVKEIRRATRRKFAVDYCEQLRRKGVSAYYRHDGASSIVTVGLFERSAVTLIRKGKKVQRQVRDVRIRSYSTNSRTWPSTGGRSCSAPSTSRPRRSSTSPPPRT